MAGLALDRPKRACRAPQRAGAPHHGIDGYYDDSDDEEFLPKVEESVCKSPSRPKRISPRSNKQHEEGNAGDLNECKRVYLLPHMAIRDTDRQVIESLVDDWMGKHQSKGPKIVQTVLSSCVKAFFDPARDIRKDGAWSIWAEVLTSYNLKVMDRYPFVKNLNIVAARMRDRMFEAMDDMPLMTKAKVFHQNLSVEIQTAYTELKHKANEFAHQMAETAWGQEYVDRARNDPSTKYIICPEDFIYSPPPRRSNHHRRQRREHRMSPIRLPERPAPPVSSPVPQQQTSATASTITAPTNVNEQRTAMFAQSTAKARAKARALAELKVREADLKGQQIQMKIEKLHAERALIELDEE